jgi:uncharacterized protein
LEVKELEVDTKQTFTAFSGYRRIATGDLQETILRTKACLDRGEMNQILIFEDQTGRQIDFDFRGTPDEVISRLASHPHFAPSNEPDKPRTGPGRPKLGVVCREVSLLPRHWDWLQIQSGGASAALRRLVDEARKNQGGNDRTRGVREAVGKFMWAMAGNLPNFEEASRALYAGDQKQLELMMHDWPEDLRNHIRGLLTVAVCAEA